MRASSSPGAQLEAHLAQREAVAEALGDAAARGGLAPSLTAARPASVSQGSRVRWRAQVDDGLAQHRGDRQRHQRADHPVQLQPQQQREDHQQRVDAQRVAEDLRRDDVALDLLEPHEQQQHPHRGDRVLDERDERSAAARRGSGPM